jgi:putative nucleotidyltransferase with HDIG domain
VSEVYRVQPPTTDTSLSNSYHAERVLIVDDEPLIRDLVTKVVSSLGLQSDTVQNGEEALQRLARTEYEVVLSDITMPVLDGLDLLHQISSRYPEIAVIMITGISDVSSAVDALSTGAYDYITKPFHVLELKGKIQRALERRRLVLENRQYHSHLEGRVRQQTAELREALAATGMAYTQTLEALINALDARERETQKHSKRVSNYTVLMARNFGIPASQLVDIERGSLLHDVGKIGISDNTLLKPGRLNEDEWIEIRKHPDIGYQILSGIGFLKGAAEMVRQHHERFDGTGYPQGLAGEQILLGARMFAVIDTFDAMTSDRPYRKALSYQKAREEIIRCAHTQFDPQLVDCFLQVSEDTWLESRQNLKRLKHTWPGDSLRID